MYSAPSESTIITPSIFEVKKSSTNGCSYISDVGILNEFLLLPLPADGYKSFAGYKSSAGNNIEDSSDR